MFFLGAAVGGPEADDWPWVYLVLWVSQGPREIPEES